MLNLARFCSTIFPGMSTATSCHMFTSCAERINSSLRTGGWRKIDHRDGTKKMWGIAAQFGSFGRGVCDEQPKKLTVAQAATPTTDVLGEVRSLRN